ncbi:MAG: hypothetical protein JWO48_1840, partial [Bryobacterales bacterium]|nr:hypothetical protein [Bryobacterales bacterium]
MPRMWRRSGALDGAMATWMES